MPLLIFGRRPKIRRHAHCEDRAFAKFAACLYRTFEEAGKDFNDVQTEPRTGEMPRRCTVDLAKLVKNQWQQILGNSRSGICDLDLESVILINQLERHSD